MENNPPVTKSDHVNDTRVFRTLPNPVGDGNNLRSAPSSGNFKDQNGRTGSVHAVPFTLPFHNDSATNTVMPGRLQRSDDNFSMIFRRKYERLDWRKLAALDLEKVYKTQDVKSLQENLTQLAFFDLEEELVRLINKYQAYPYFWEFQKIPKNSFESPKIFQNETILSIGKMLLSFQQT